MYSILFCRMTWFVKAAMPLSLYLMRGGQVDYFSIILKKIILCCKEKTKNENKAFRLGRQVIIFSAGYYIR